MKSETIRFTGGENWLVIDLYRFLHYLNVLYNRLYVLQNYADLDFPKLKEHLDNSLYYIGKGNELSIHSLAIQSPFETILTGVPIIFKAIKSIYTKFSFNELTKREKEIAVSEGELALEERRLGLIEKEIEIELKNTELIRNRISLLKENGFKDEEISELIKPLITSAKKMINSGKENDVQIIS